MTNDYFEVKYYPTSDNCNVPKKATKDSVGYDLYTAENKDILPWSNASVSLDLRIIIPFGFFGKIFSRSGLFMNNNITAEAGVIDSDFRGIVKVLLLNHSDQKFSVEVGQRIAQMVFLKKLGEKFVESNELPSSERQEDRLGSTGSF